MRAVGYARISRSGPRADPYGLARQRREIEQWARDHGHELVAIEEDQASARSRRKRPGRSEHDEVGPGLPRGCGCSKLTTSSEARNATR